jgi:hypothetical protein
MKRNNSDININAIKERLKNNKGVFIICGIYAVISVVLFFIMTRGKIVVSPDSLSYIQPAKHILRDGFFSTDGVNPEYSRTPGYPLFLALIYFLGGTDMAVIVIQMALMTLKIYLFYEILLALAAPGKLALAGSALLLINVQSYGYSFSVLTEPLFGFLLVFALFCLVKYLYCGRNYCFFLAFSLALNYALLVRPILLYFNLSLCVVPLVFLVLKKINGVVRESTGFLNKPNIKCFMTFCLCFVVMFGGWSLRNYAHSSVFIFTTINNNDAARLQTPVLTAYMHNMPYISYPGYAEGISEANEENLLREYPELGGNNLNEAQKSILRGKYGFGFIKKHFDDFVILNLKGFVGEMFLPFGTVLLNGLTGMSKTAVIVQIVQIGFCVFLYTTYLLFLLGFVANIRSNKVVNIGIFIICAYLSIPGAIYATPRFRDPFFPLILLSAIYNSPVIIRLICNKLNIPAIKRVCSYLLDR